MSRLCARRRRSSVSPPLYAPRAPRLTHLAPHALLSTWQNANDLSDANKLLIRCAWTGESAFADAGYDEDSWASGRCPPPSNMKFGGDAAGVVGPAVGGAVGALFLLGAVVAAVVIWKKNRSCAARRAAAGDCAQSEA